jgi:hypothetical protein
MEMQIIVYFLASPLKCVCNKLRGMGALLGGTRVAHVTSEARVKKNSARRRLEFKYTKCLARKYILTNNNGTSEHYTCY